MSSIYCIHNLFYSHHAYVLMGAGSGYISWHLSKGFLTGLWSQCLGALTRDCHLSEGALGQLVREVYSKLFFTVTFL